MTTTLLTNPHKKMKKIIFLLTALLLAAPSAFAQNFSFFTVAPSGQTLYYKIVNSSEVSVTYPGSNLNNTYSGYTKPTGVLTIPSNVTNGNTTYSVTSVGEGAFFDCTELTSVTIPEGVTSIGLDAFRWCSGLISITIPSSVTSIGENAFSGCSGLTSIECLATVPPTIEGTVDFYALPTDIPVYVPCGKVADYQAADGWSIFTNIQAIPVTEFDLAASTGQILHYTINRDGNTVTLSGHEDGISGELVIPETVTYCGNTYTVNKFESHIFKNCVGLTSVTIPQTIHKIEYSCFTSCTNLSTVNLPNTIDSIETFAFQYCSSLASITIPDATTYLASYALSSCTNLTTVTLGNSLTKIGDQEFYNCTNLSSINIPASVTTIGSGAFYNCSSLTSLILPDSLTTIGSHAFRGCSGITSFTIPKLVNHISKYAFTLCTGISSLTSLAAVPPTLDEGVFNNIPTSIPVYVPCGKVADYQAADGWNQFTNIQEIPVTEFDLAASTGQILHYTINNDGTTVTLSGHEDGISGDLVIPSSVDYCGNTYIVTIIGNSAFSSCSTLTSIVIPETATRIEQNAFRYCRGLTEVIIPDNVTYIGDYAFSECSRLATVTIGASVNDIGSGAFYPCSALTSVYLYPTTPPTFSALITIIRYNPFFYSNENRMYYVPCGTKEAYVNAFSMPASHFTEAWTPYNVVLSGNNEQMASSDVEIICTSTFNITATPNCGYRFVRWEDAAGNTVSTDNPFTLIVTQDTALTAVFEAAETTHIAIVSPSGHTLHYLLDCSNLTASVVPENASYPYYTTEPAGDLVIPSSIEYGNNTYTVTTIGNKAFIYCDYLTSVVIPNTVVSIGQEAFFDCRFIESLSIGNSVESIGRNAFAACFSISSITVADGNTHFDSRNNCNAIIETSTNTLIVGCQATVIPTTVTTIGQRAFYGCSTLNSIFIPHSVSYIGAGAFMDCSGLASMTVDVDNTHYDSRENCNAIIKTSTNTLIAGCKNTIIPHSVTAIAELAFRYCEQLSSITIPSKVASIGSEAFLGCRYLAELTLMSTIPPAIVQDAFYEVSTDIPVNIPCGSLAAYQSATGWSSFTNFVEGDVFPYSLSVTSADNTMGSAAVTVEPTCTNYGATVTAYPICGYRFVRWEDAAGNTVSTDNPFTLIVTQDTALTAVFETGASQVALVCPSGQTLYYRLDCTNLTATVMPQNSSNPYYTTEPAGDLVIPSSIEYGNNTYTVTTIGQNAFYYCTSLTSAVIPNSITSIGGHAFFDCWGIESLSIGNSVESIGSGAFAFCYGLSSITVAADNTHFDSRNNCNAIIRTATNTLIAGCQSTIIPNTVTTIADNAFRGCETLTTIHIPHSVSYIGTGAFDGCHGLTSMTVDAQNTHYDSRENCNAIINTSTNTLIAGCRNTVIPNSVTSIAGEAFRYCRHLTSITIPSKVASIGSESFYGCYDLAEITLLAAIPPSIGNYTFRYVSTDIPVHIPCGSLAAYQASNRWSSFTNFIEGDVFLYTLTVTSAHSAMGSAAVTVEPTCANNNATITATPNSGYQFYRWSDGNTDNPRTVSVTSDSALTAFFTLTGSASGSSDPSPSVSCGEYQWPAIPFPALGVQIKQKHDHTSAFAAQGWDTVVTLSTPTIELSCMPYIPVQYFNGQYTVDEIPYNPADTSFHAGTRMPISTDDNFAQTATNIPFPFYFFGERKSAFVIGANGMVSFNPAVTGKYCAYSYSAPLPWPDGTTGAPNHVSLMRDAIYGIYEDTYPSYSQVSGNDGIYYGIQDAFPMRKIVCSWNNIPLYSCTNNRSSYQIVCYEGTNIIEVHVKQRQACPGFNGGRGIIGIQNATGLPQLPSSDPSNPTHSVTPGAPAAFWPQGKNIFTSNLTETAYRFTPQGTTSYSYKWYRVFDDGRDSVELTSSPNDPNGYFIPMDESGTCPTLTRAVVSPTEPAKYVFELRFHDANNNLYTLYDTCSVGVNFDTAIHIHMELVGDSLFAQESQSMVVTHPDSTYVKLRFDVEPAAERVEVLDQGQNVVATFLDATEEHVFRLTTGLYTIRAVFPGGATFEGTIDFVNELQE